MRLIWLARVLGLSGVSAVSAVAAHEGPAALAGGRPLLAALAGAAAAAMGVCGVVSAAAARYARVARVGRGDMRAARLDPGGPLPASVLVAALLVCQGGAHTTLILLGAAAHGGTAAPVALHVVFALAGAVVMVALERLLGAATCTLAGAIAAAAELLARLAVSSPGRPPRRRWAAPPVRAHRCRAPPLAANLGF